VPTKIGADRSSIFSSYLFIIYYILKVDLNDPDLILIQIRSMSPLTKGALPLQRSSTLLNSILISMLV